MPAVFAHTHVVCLPSYREGLPKVLVEAAACVRATVATDVPGCREIVRSGVNGILVPARDAIALARAIPRLVHDADLRSRFGVAGRQMAESEFSVDRVVMRTMDVYRTLMACGGRKSRPTTAR